MIRRTGRNQNNQLREVGLSDLRPVACCTTESAAWLKSGFGLRLDCFLGFFAMPHFGTIKPGKEIKIQTDPVPNFGVALIRSFTPVADENGKNTV
jgi:hypothetical protein